MTLPEWTSKQGESAADDPSGGPASVVTPIVEQSQVGEARRSAMVLAERAGLGETERGSLAIIVTEAATNLAKHATSGLLALRIVGTPPRGGVEVLALDKGPGIRDLTRAMSDGFSTGGTSGHGLGAIRRMATEFDLFSGSHGTALLARLWPAAASASSATATLDGVVCVPVATETASGDGWAILHAPQRTMVVVVDGLGHGVEAAKASDAALRVAREHGGWPPARIIEEAHGALRVTRGAAIGIAEIAMGEQVVRYAGVGNISGVIASVQGTRSMASHNGTVGHVMHRVQEFTYPWSRGACLIMHSDGIMTRWRLDAYPGLVGRHPGLVAGVLYRDFTRGRDDATVVAVRVRDE